MDWQAVMEKPLTFGTAIIVSVDFADFLAVTLPWNKHHFDRVLVITHPEDEATLRVCSENQVDVLQTEMFHWKRAHFNKWAAVEFGLDYIGKTGWITLLDADIMIPQVVQIRGLEIGKAYCPRKRAVPREKRQWIRDETKWSRYRFEDLREPPRAHMLTFHADDPVLQRHPWFTNIWRWCGTGDDTFVERWKSHNVVRPLFDVLHLGQRRVNWCGRTETYLDGTYVPDDIRDLRQQNVGVLLRQSAILRGVDDRYKGGV